MTPTPRFYSSPSCDGDQRQKHPKHQQRFLFFPVLRRGSIGAMVGYDKISFYSSPSCDGDQVTNGKRPGLYCFYSSPSCDGDHPVSVSLSAHLVSILPRLATGIDEVWYKLKQGTVSILPRLATGIVEWRKFDTFAKFLFFPVLRRGSGHDENRRYRNGFLFFPVLRRGSEIPVQVTPTPRFYSSPSCDGDPPPQKCNRGLARFYSSPSCDGDPCVILV